MPRSRGEVGHLTACYDSAEPDKLFTWESTPFGMATPLYVYSDYGKFTKGLVYVQVTFEGGQVFTTPMPPPGEDLPFVEVFYQGGFEVVAQR